MVVWELTGGWQGSIQGLKQGKIDKVYVRHGLVVFVQGGLVQVVSPGETTTLIYSKSFEQPDVKLLYGCSHPDGLDNTNVPPLTRQQFRMRYKPGANVRCPDEMDITVSTVGEERLGVGLVGDTHVTIYQLRDGELEQQFQLETGLEMVKLGIVHLPDVSSLLYVLVRSAEGYSGLMYNLEKTADPAPLWRLSLHETFSYHQTSVFSVFSSRGILIFGRKKGDSDYPFTWLWRLFNYHTGQQVSHIHSLHEHRQHTVVGSGVHVRLPDRV